jgi:hypothetical protein
VNFSVPSRRARPLGLLVALVLVGGLLSATPGSAVAQPAVQPAARTGVQAGAQPSVTASAVEQKKKAKKPALCRKLYYSRVMGQRPTYARGLKSYPARSITCRAYWLTGVDDNFVPQAVAIDGATAWVSGYTWPSDVNHNRCRVQHINLTTGALMADQVLLGGKRADGHYEECRHGGGLALDANGLWISESGRLWLVNPSKVGVDPTNAVTRYWDVPQSPVRASTIVINNDTLGMAYYTSNPSQSVLSWFGIARLLAPGVQTLVASPTLPTEAGTYRQQVLPTRTQGLFWWKGHGGLYSTRSHGACSRVVAPGGRQFGVIPGLEDIEFSADGSRAYLMSEKAARPFTGPGEKLVPFLTQVPAKDLLKLRGAGSCS